MKLRDKHMVHVSRVAFNVGKHGHAGQRLYLYAE